MKEFRQAIPLWCSLASRILGWRPDDFWSATPAELAAAMLEPDAATGHLSPSLEKIAQMMERDSNE